MKKRAPIKDEVWFLERENSSRRVPRGWQSLRHARQRIDARFEQDLSRNMPIGKLQTTPLVLIVDDDKVATQIIENALQQIGLRTQTAHDRAGALRLVGDCRPDLILLDVSLPDGNGVAICRELQDQPYRCAAPVIFVSIHDDLAVKMDAFDGGAVDYITKPLSTAEVAARVKLHLRLKQAYDSLADVHAEQLKSLTNAQQSCMPTPVSKPEAKFEVFLRQLVQAGGDFYDVIKVGEHQFDYIVADASGHESSSSFWTLALKALLLEYARVWSSPSEILHQINRALLRILPAGIFFTMIYARLNRMSSHLTIVNAAHPSALIVKEAEFSPEVLWQDGDVIGAFSDATFSTREIVVHPGDRLFLYSDGLVENTSGLEQGIAKLSAAVAGRRHLSTAELVRTVGEGRTATSAIDDDVLLVGIEI